MYGWIFFGNNKVLIPTLCEAAHYFNPSQLPREFGEVPQAVGFFLYVFIKNWYEVLGSFVNHRWVLQNPT